MISHVLLQIETIHKSLVTYFTFVWSFQTVLLHHVACQATPLNELNIIYCNSCSLYALGLSRLQRPVDKLKCVEIPVKAPWVMVLFEVNTFQTTNSLIARNLSLNPYYLRQWVASVYWIRHPQLLTLMPWTYFN